MSKRFGRNQKRAMRQQINAAQEQSEKFEHAHQMSLGLQKYTSARLEEAASTLRLVAEILGKNFVALEPEQINVYGHSVPMPRPQPRNIQRMHSTEIIESVTESLLNFKLCEFKAELDALRENIHFRYITPAGDVGYAINAQEWLKMPRRVRIEFAQREIARDMAHNLARDRSVNP